MARPVSPEKRRYRPWVIGCVLAQFLLCPVAIAYVLGATGNVYLTAPLGLFAVATWKLVDCLMVWLSTPTERKLLPTTTPEQLMAIIRELLSGPRQSPPPGGKSGGAAP